MMDAQEHFGLVEQEHPKGIMIDELRHRREAEERQNLMIMIEQKRREFAEELAREEIFKQRRREQDDALEQLRRSAEMKERLGFADKLGEIDRLV